MACHPSRPIDYRSPGQICDKDSNDLSPTTPPTPRESDRGPDDWTPYQNRAEFELADFLYRRTQISAGNINTLLDIWASTLAPYGAEPPFRNHDELYDTIDLTPLGGIPWESFSVKYNEDVPDDKRVSWMDAEYEAWFRDPQQLVLNIISSPDFKDAFDYAPFHEYDKDLNHRFHNFMSGDWAWIQANIIARDPETHGSTFIPIILGSDKTTVSVATGNNQYWPFRCQLFHSCLSQMLLALRPGMTNPIVTRCPDGHFRRVIFGLATYIADYPEQALLSCTVQGWCAKSDRATDDVRLRNREHTNTIVELLELGELWDEYGFVGDVVPFTEDFPRADIHEMLSPDILHQLIKGTFKDHLVAWVKDFLFLEHGEHRANKILSDIDRRIAVVAPFAGLRRFPEGRGFSQWTGDDSKALMKVYLPAIDGHVPSQMVCAIRAFMEFCYIVRREVHDTKSLQELQDALDRFHEYRIIFAITGVRDDFNLPWQHSLIHYYKLIRAYGAPNGLCSSITESKHIKAIKEPWRRSNRYNALGQMLLMNQRLDKLAASFVDFEARDMLIGSLYAKSTPALRGAGTTTAVAHGGDDDLDSDNDDNFVEDRNVFACVELAKTIARRRVDPSELTNEIKQPCLVLLIRRFLHDQLERTEDLNNWSDSSSSSLPGLPFFNSPISVYLSALAIFREPSDMCGTGRLRHECIRAVPSWRRGPARYDCVFVETNNAADGMRGLDVARVYLFFSFIFRGKFYPCALVHWYCRVGDEPDKDTGMWVVEAEKGGDGAPRAAVLHLDSIIRAAHLIEQSLSLFRTYYVNKFIDHHSFSIAF
ncbi:hypothetical protein EDB89DRAFT_2116421 [Lactarius sanguifluus]|nr:hypothetical protein EDB89DRAFT_2116421 [Lactarius sanguifluus]